jgi:multidrug efflux pump subunit AcrA (membrane-fusion protein)
MTVKTVANPQAVVCADPDRALDRALLATAAALRPDAPAAARAELDAALADYRAQSDRLLAARLSHGGGPPGLPSPGTPSEPRFSRAHAMLTPDRPHLDPPEPAPDAPVCEAPGCGRPLTTAQLARGARACSPACRRAAHRARQRDRRLAEIDASIAGLESALALLRQHRAEIARG